MFLYYCMEPHIQHIVCLLILHYLQCVQKNTREYPRLCVIYNLCEELVTPLPGVGAASPIYSMRNHANRTLTSASSPHRGRLGALIFCVVATQEEPIKVQPYFRSWEDRRRPELKLLMGIHARDQGKNQVGSQEMGKTANLGPPCFSKQRLASECCQKEGG